MRRGAPHGMLEDMGVRCLIVDDNPGFVQTARKVLESGGITVVGHASTSAEALERAIQTRPDVAIVDIVLGGESGFCTARQLAALGHGSGAGPAHVILISTHAEEDFADLIAASPAIAFLPKWELSAAAVTELLARTGPDLDD
jgi:DNA-binding NarL/FixJ family response regulator